MGNVLVLVGGAFIIVITCIICSRSNERRLAKMTEEERFQDWLDSQW